MSDRKDKRDALPQGETLDDYAKELLKRMPCSHMTRRETWALKAYIERLERLSVWLFTQGYGYGQDDAVEGAHTDIDLSDLDYFADHVADLLKEDGDG